ncbi:hypothetical protein QUB80_32255 [Chlorogloeopsis sp. ULAP01]|uniref:hypothetical protein n=1 Tax=Chlorogloeopsis sp. ULAP01 TaxID=3056483 RepID=UPI0025AAC938|nr:hypothetical protein [Chlorogloeopsis sp. ULAP01]MDM9385329.1 hypothetical protein [Chlorogloeopsis sp. ULAP01]
MVDRSIPPAPKPYKQNQQNKSSANTTKKHTVKKVQKNLKKRQGKILTHNSQKGTKSVLHQKNKAKTTSARRGSHLASIVAIAVLLGSVGLIAGFAWVSIELILNPDKVTWLNQLIPTWVKFSFNSTEQPQSLDEIQINLTKQGWMAGEILPLKANPTEAFVLPVLKQRANCQSNCKDVVEVRVYQRSHNLELQSKPEKYYNLMAKLPVTGLEESFVLNPLVNANSERQGSSTLLPVSEVGRFDGDTPSPGIWFYLQGKRTSGTNAIAYGYIVHYNPERSHLQLMLSWTSPSGKLPEWRQVTGSGAKELVVDQTVGFEPQLRVYQAKPIEFILNPVQLEEVSLQSPALNDSAYQNALLIARSGLWTPAWEWLQFISKKRQGKMPAAAQAQIDLIRLHSQFTKTQADTTWVSPSQQVLADLIDGRWEKALQVFEASPQNAQEITTLLKADAGRLWSRVEAALQVNPHRSEVQAWGALILAVQYGHERTNSFLKEQTKLSQESFAYIQSLLAQQLQINPTHPSRIIGSVQAIAAVNPTDWWQPNFAETQKIEKQAWYQVQVSAFHNGKRWLYSPFANLNSNKTSSIKSFWQSLGFSSDPDIEIVVWLASGEQQIVTATVKGIRLRNTELQLLVAVDEKIPQDDSNAMQPSPLALTSEALEWVQPSPITLEQLYQQNGLRVKVILPTVWRLLQTSGQLPPGEIPSFPQMLQKLGYWPVQEIDLTGNGKSETVVTISTEAIKSLHQTSDEDQEQQPQQSRPRTIILSDTGKIIYTDFSNNSVQFLTAIAKLSTADSLTLLVENANTYRLKRWSEKNQRFE